jgi:DNA repair exonuclease SbcCD nuclease subunit
MRREVDGNPLPFRLKNSTATVFELNPAIFTRKLGLVITDHHLGLWGRAEEDIPLFLTELNALVTAVKPDYILMLGDTIHYGNPAPPFVTLIDGFAQLNVPIFILGGNHDRRVLAQLESAHQSVTIVRDLAIGITAAEDRDEWRRIVFAHDLLNDMKVNPQDVGIWVWWMKDVFHEICPPDDLLFWGHAHQIIWNADRKCCSLGRFAPTLRSYHWALIRENGGLSVQFVNSKNYSELALK